jgi:alpha-D-ribose 1-methylphosphonate 5-triphosphate synthase subunit PhnG
MTLTDREHWGPALAAADPAAVTALAGRITARARVEAMAPPREGLMLLQMRDSVAGSPFHLGEIPVARVHLRLMDGGQVAEGGAVLMSDDLARATQIAVLDAALAAGWDEAPEIEALISAGQAGRARIEAERALVLERTRVDFQLLSEDDA